MAIKQNSILAAGILILFLNGCSSYVTRIVARSITGIGDPIELPPSTISKPVLENADLAVSWVGHATVLIQIKDKIFITDPLFTETVGMIMKRLVQPALDPTLLRKVDFTLVSHIHFDHFSFGSLDMLPKNGTLVLPLGALPYTPEFGFKEIKEMKPWDVTEEDGVRITAVPVQHFSGRYGFDSPWMRDHGYTGYVIEYAGYTVFFGGDTGYHPELFKEIGRRFKVDVAILPIAPSSLSGLGSGVHVGPVGALQIFKDVGARYLVPMHHQTLNYGSDAPSTTAVEALRKSSQEMGLASSVVDLQIGEQRVLFDRQTQPATGNGAKNPLN